MVKLLRTRLRLCRVLVRDPDEGDVHAPEGVSIRAATREDLLRAAAQGFGDLRVDFVDAALARGDVCVAAFHGNDIVAYVWRSFSTAPHGDGLWVRVDHPYWYTYKSFTRPDFRGRRLNGVLTLYGDHVCRDRGCEHGVGFIDVGNRASLRASLRIGTRVVGYAGYLRLFGRSHPFRTPGVRAHTFRFYRRASA